MWTPRICLKPSETKDPDKRSSDFRDLLTFSSARFENEDEGKVLGQSVAVSVSRFGLHFRGLCFLFLLKEKFFGCFFFFFCERTRPWKNHIDSVTLLSLYK